jgi:hypothetical protein
MGTTATTLYPYPELTDAANVPIDMRELAEAISESRYIASPPAVTASITVYPAGTSCMYVPAAAGANWPPGDQCFVVTSSAKNIATQWCSTAFTGASRVWFRSGTASSWAPWVGIGSEKGAGLIARGRVSVSVSAAVAGTLAVTFPSGLFAAGTTPRVSAMVIGSSVWMAYASTQPSVTGFTVGVRHVDATASTATVLVDWIAVEGE